MYNQIPNSVTAAIPAIANGGALLRETMFGHEMQVVVASLFEGVSEAEHIPSMVASAIKSSRVVQDIAIRASVHEGLLINKLEALPLYSLQAIQIGVEQFRAASPTEMFGPNRLPSIATLIRLGLVATRGEAAWGLAVVQLDDWRICEVVLRQDPSKMNIAHLPHSLADASAGLARLIRTELDGETVPKGWQIAMGLAGLIALRTGWPNFRIEERNSCAVLKIDREEMLADLYRGELRGLVLQDINAPEAAKV